MQEAYLVGVGGVGRAERGQRVPVEILDAVVEAGALLEVTARALARALLGRALGHAQAEVRLLDDLAQPFHPELLGLEAVGAQDDARVAGRGTAGPDGELALVALDVLGHAELRRHQPALVEVLHLRVVSGGFWVIGLFVWWVRVVTFRCCCCGVFLREFLLRGRQVSFTRRVEYLRVHGFG